ncbi:ATP-binding protein [Streptomyces murinus]|uniref:ATP-binding protein n=1 Tax=Streptomyces murinus TaxID=33900 RepID=UPI002E821624|nr:ATP-binding protein [Streptomyces murinus]WUD06303.1 ATP-binding protein [Streptomyces murinus]
MTAGSSTPDGPQPREAKWDATGFFQVNSAAHGAMVNATQGGDVNISQHYYAEPDLSDPWVIPEDSTEPSQTALYFSHHWELVGRTELLEEMASFLTDESYRGGRVGILQGVAGSGKSRVLRALAAEFTRHTGIVRELPAAAAVGRGAVRQLPEGTPLLIVIEDVHLRPGDLLGILGDIRRERPHAVVIMSVRPSGAADLRGTFRRLGLDETLVPTWELGELSTRQAQALAAQALDEENRRHLARRLAAAVGDSAFLLVFSAVQIARGGLDAYSLESDAGLRQQVLDAFIETAFPDQATRAEDRALLHAVAALQPVRVDQAGFISALADLLHAGESVVRARLDRLVAIGVLARRRNSYRILPDLLGDVLLAEAALDAGSGAHTGFLGNVLAVTRGEPLSHLLVNTGRVEWQWSRIRPRCATLVEPLWQLMGHAYAEGDSEVRSELLQVVRRIAAYQPRRALDLLRPVVETALPDDPHVLKDIPPVLAAVAQDPNHLGAALDLLWKIGRHDPRPVHSTPHSALRLIGDLASYAPDKPLCYQEALVDAVERWTHQGMTCAVERMPLALLDHVFETTAERREPEGWNLVVSRLPLAAERVASVRVRAFQVLVDALGATDVAKAGAAARSLAEAFRGQHGAFGDLLLTNMATLAARTREVRPEPMVALAIRRSVHWHVTYGPAQAAVAAREVLAALPDSLSHRLARLLYSDAHEWRMVDDDYDFEAAEKSWQNQIAVAADQASEWSDDMAWEALRHLLETGRQVFTEIPPGCGPLLSGMTSGRPGRAAAFIRGAQEGDDSVVDLVLTSALRGLWEDAPLKAERLTRDLLDTGRIAVIRAVIRASAARVATAVGLHRQELAAADRMSAHADHAVRAEVLRMAVAMTRRSRTRTAGIELLCSVPFSDLTGEFCWAFFGPDSLTWSELNPGCRAACQTRLITSRNWEDHRVQMAVAALSEEFEDEALQLLLKRQEAWENAPAPDYEPLPYSWGATAPFKGSPRRRELLRTIVCWFEEPRENPWRREIYGVELFKLIAGNVYDRVVREVLLEPLTSLDPVRAAAVAPLLSGAHDTFLWEEPQFVAQVLRAAIKVSDDLYRRVGGRLMNSVTCGLKTTSPGKPFPKDLQIRERATQVREILPLGSPEDRLYAALQDHARAEIDMALNEDWDLDSRRQW